ncbi:PstS family phosphate ABC transporter substrate-binding protein [Thermobrachium celere]|uniref:Phosphate-binding protein n=1 Tax=Thermobrachium celere DSM 8682 TaxID=941824 RepID=R7RRW4_9CLOT|nr:PstS family phosphate ABC transporter substrate-binding protein [Thermobrachium celere]GFR34941.1 phosphate ABC transporter substrate-binding protein [Thermobrachium celere]CDF58942.1 Phosphate ABC transporter, periplasmic phosphate-binding protein PstS (TC 3.A.1.7.1) [Thermobrachium celere DSM 8682]
MKAKKFITLALTAVLSLSMISCAGQKSKSLSGTIKIDGSSTVYPITQAVAEEFKKENQGVEITVGVSGTGGGFKKFVVGEIDINNASRHVKQEELDKAKANGIEMTEVQVAFDGIAVVVNKQNDWAKDMTVEELKMIWDKDSKVQYWSDVRPEWPKEKIKLYGPGTDSGTFEYFTEAINGKAKQIRADYTASEDDNVLVQGVAGDKYAMGFFGLAYYEENMDKLNVVKVNGVEPTVETVKNGTYKPLSRPLFIYVSNKALERPEVKEFVKFYLTKGKDLVKEVGYIPMEDSKYQEELNKIK